MNEELRKFRKEKTYSIDSMADMLGISKSYYEKIEYGDRQPSFNFIKNFKTKFPEADVESIFLPTVNT